MTNHQLPWGNYIKLNSASIMEEEIVLHVFFYFMLIWNAKASQCFVSISSFSLVWKNNKFVLQTERNVVNLWLPKWVCCWCGVELGEICGEMCCVIMWQVVIGCDRDGPGNEMWSEWSAKHTVAGHMSATLLYSPLGGTSSLTAHLSHRYTDLIALPSKEE